MVRELSTVRVSRVIVTVTFGTKSNPELESRPLGRKNDLRAR